MQCGFHGVGLQMYVLCGFSGSQHLKYMSLVTLVVQNAALALSMRYARTRQGHMFMSSTGE
jgi:hypothetical protein